MGLWAIAASLMLPAPLLFAQAGPTPINGQIGIASGLVTFNTASLGQAHSIVSFTNVTVGVADGSYSGLSNAVIAWTPFSFNPPAATVKPLWTCATNGVTYSFDATSVTNVFQNSGYLNLSGTGVAHITGQADTLGTWSLAAESLGSKFTFSASIQVSNSFNPVLTCSPGSGTLGFNWNSLEGQAYVLQGASNLTSASWLNLSGPLVATNQTTGANIEAPTGPAWFYRVAVPY